MRRYPDLSFRDEGSISLLEPLTDTGASWMAEHLVTEDVQWFGQALCVEHRFVADIVAGAIEDGLRVTVERGN
jgi:hypothetical protein